MTSAQRTIRWGVVSTGNIAHTVTSDLMLLEGSELAAVSSRDLSRAEAFAAEFGGARAYASVHELVAADDVDVVYIATPHAQHPVVLRAAIEAGKAVLCEKSFTTSLADTIELTALAQARGVFCMEAMWTRFTPLIVKARALVDAGAIGEVRSVSAELGFPGPADPGHRLWDPALGGGALLDVGIYPVAFAQMLLGAPATVEAVGSLTDAGVDAEAGILLGWDGGARAHLESSLRSPLAGNAVVIGTTGRLEIPPRFHHPSLLRHVHAEERGKEETTGYESEPEGRGYVPMLRAVAQAVRDGRTECPEMPLADTVAVMRIMDAVLRQLGVEYPDPAPVPA